MLEGVLRTAPKSTKVDMILKRRQAIETAINEARPDDLIVLAGKGHEGYELVGNQLLPHDDRELARHAMRQ